MEGDVPVDGEIVDGCLDHSPVSILRSDGERKKRGQQRHVGSPPVARVERIVGRRHDATDPTLVRVDWATAKPRGHRQVAVEVRSGQLQVCGVAFGEDVDDAASSPVQDADEVDRAPTLVLMNAPASGCGYPKP